MKVTTTRQDVRVGSLHGRVYGGRNGGSSDGPVFVALHGIGMSHRYFRRLRAALERVGVVYALDLPGFGATPNPPRALSVEEYGAFAAAALRKLEIPACVLIGHSMGVQFGVELARQQPGLVSHLVLIGPVVDPGRRTVPLQALALARDTLGERPSTNAIVLTDYLRCGPWRYLAELGAMMEYRTEEKIAAVAAPVLVMRGARDPIARRPWCRSLAQRAQRGRFVEVPGGFHVVQESAPELVLAAIAAFVAEQFEVTGETP